MAKWFSSRFKSITMLSGLLAATRLIRVRSYYCGWIILLMIIISGCAMIPMPSHSSVDNQLPIVQPLDKGETIVVYGVDGELPRPADHPYFIFWCRTLPFNRDTIMRLTDSIQDRNPALLAAKGLREELESMLGVELPQIGLDLKLSDIFTARVAENHVRYLLFVKEKVETTIHVPLYFIPGGVAACGNKTILDAGLWELPSGKFVGTLRTSAESEFVVLAWVFHLVFVPDTQASAVQKLAQETIEKLTGSTLDEKTNHATPLEEQAAP